MSTSTLSKNQNCKSQLESVPAPPGAVPISKPRKPRPGFRRIVIGWRPVPLHADLVDEVALAGRLAQGDKKWRPVPGVRCSKCWLKNPRPGHFCRWNIANSPHNPPRKIVYVPLFRWVPE